jgi:hypothetical protein
MGTIAGVGKNNFVFIEFSLTASDFRIMILPSRSFQGGGSRSSRYVGRDAVDVDTPLTNGVEADGEDVWS